MAPIDYSKWDNLTLDSDSESEKECKPSGSPTKPPTVSSSFHALGSKTSTSSVSNGLSTSSFPLISKPNTLDYSKWEIVEADENQTHIPTPDITICLSRTGATGLLPRLGSSSTLPPWAAPPFVVPAATPQDRETHQTIRKNGSLPLSARDRARKEIRAALGLPKPPNCFPTVKVKREARKIHGRKEVEKEWKPKAVELSNLPVAKSHPPYPEITGKPAAIDVLFEAIKRFFASGLTNASILWFAIDGFWARKIDYINLQCLTLKEDTLGNWTIADRSSIERLLHWSCRESYALVGFYGETPRREVMRKLQVSAETAWSLGYPQSERTAPFMEVRPIRSVINQARALVENTESVIVICCTMWDPLIDDTTSTDCFVPNSDTECIVVTHGHLFTIAVSAKGIRVFQGMDVFLITLYTLPEYIERGDARLRPWNEAETFISNLQFLAETSGPWTPQIFSAWKYCFGVDLSEFIYALRKNVGSLFRLHDVYQARLMTLSSMEPVTSKEIVGRYKWDLLK